MRRRAFLAAGAATLGLSQLLLQVQRAAAEPITVRPEHPRLLLSDFDHPRSVIKNDPVAAAWYGKIKSAADVLLDQPPVTYQIPDGLRLLATSREAQHRVYTLSFAYAVEGDTGYRDRLWTELAAVCAFPDWNHQRHFLDVAEMTHAVAIGYDWWHAEWSAEQRATLETAIVEYGLEPGLAVYGGAPTAHKWPTWTNNWNIVCNGGMITGALAVADRFPDVTQDVITKALASLPLAIGEYAPDGGYPEGAGYWEYAAKYLVLLLAVLDSATGGDDGLSESPGVATTVDFPLHLAGPTGLAFNYYDGAAGSSRIPEMFWFARRFDRPDYAWLARLGASTRQPGWAQLPVGLIWYDPERTRGPVASGTALDASFAHCAVVTARSGWERDEALFLAGKAGDNATSHADLDLGSWVLEALGQRWFVELGSDNYNLPGYFHEPRWTYYRKRPEGQNTLVVNPGEDPGQRPDAVGTVVARKTGPAESWFVIDATGAHPDVVSWRRGWRLFDHRRRVIVQDEITIKEPGDLWWFAHTSAKITISADGRSATLTLAGQRLLARVLTPDATFLELSARPLWTSPDPSGQATNQGLRKLTVRLPETAAATLAIEFVPLIPGAALPSPAPVTELAAWPAPAAKIATLTDLAVDGETIPGFAPGNFTYGVDLPGDPTITAAAEPGTKINILPGRSDQPTRVITVRPGHQRGVYWVWRRTPLGLGNFPETIIASTDDGNVPANTMDGDLSTRWSAEGDGQWIAYDLGSDGPVDKIKIAWSSGDARVARFDVEVAAAGETSWRPVFSGSSSGTSAAYETYDLEPSTARYLRIVGHGNSANGWNSITEVEIPGRSVDVRRDNRLESLSLAVGAVPIGKQVAGELTGTMTDGSAADLAGLAIDYVALDPEVATVAEDGMITGVTDGTARIAAIAQLADHRLVHTRTSVAVADPDRPKFPCLADSYVRDGSYAGQNFGGHGGMIIKYVPQPDSGFTRRAFLAFAPAAQTRPISRVLLHFYGRVADNNGTETELVFRLAAGGFEERKLTWQNQPALADRVGELRLDSTAAWHAVDLTAGLTALISRGAAVHLAIVQEPATGQGLATDLSSRESANAPYLEVQLG